MDYDYIDNDEDPFPISSDDNHGTNVAGVIAMEKDNGICGIGVAYQSSVTGNNRCIYYEVGRKPARTRPPLTMCGGN